MLFYNYILTACLTGAKNNNPTKNYKKSYLTQLIHPVILFGPSIIRKHSHQFPSKGAHIMDSIEKV